MMKGAILCILFAFGLEGSAQDLTPKEIDDLIGNYKAKYETSEFLISCGHLVDGPAYWGKEIENNSLDALKSLTTYQSEEIGKSILQDVDSKYEIAYDHPSQPGLLKIISNLKRHSKYPSVQFKLYVLDSQEINAFTTLGNYIYVTTGLLEFVTSIDELAFILGHEIAHADNHHTERKVTKLWLSSNILSSAGLEDYTEIASSINLSLSAPFDQMDEYEADKDGFTMAKRAGYDSSKFINFFVKLEEFENINLIEKLTSTHPFPSHRKRCMLEY